MLFYISNNFNKLAFTSNFKVVQPIGIQKKKGFNPSTDLILWNY